jgi:hypothetical protein
MNEHFLYNLLIVVKNNGDATRLIREGLTYKQIADMTKAAIKDEYIIFNENDELTTTKKGDSKITDLDSEFKKTDKTQWIEAENKSKVPKLEKKFIFLPNQNEINF